MNDVLVSIVLPTYNRAHLLPCSINSVLQQTIRNIELIIVDDGSTDDTAAVVASYKDPRIRYIPLEKNQGVGAARNTGLKLATAPYVAFQDSDDFWLPEKLQLKLAALDAADEDVGVVYCGRLIYGRDDNNQYGERCVSYVPSRTKKTVAGDLYTSLLSGNILTTTMLLAKREIMLATGGFDLTLRADEDWDMALRLAQQTKFAFVHIPLIIAYVSEDSISRDFGACAEALIRIVEKHKTALAAHPSIYAQHLFSIGRAYTKLGQPQNARLYLLRAAKTDPLSWKIWAGLLMNEVGGRELSTERKAPA